MRITVVADPADNDLRVTAEKLAGAARVTSLGALEALLDRLSPVPGGRGSAARACCRASGSRRSACSAAGAPGTGEPMR